MGAHGAHVKHHVLTKDTIVELRDRGTSEATDFDAWMDSVSDVDKDTGWCPPVMLVGLDSPHEYYSYIYHKP